MLIITKVVNIVEFLLYIKASDSLGDVLAHASGCSQYGKHILKCTKNQIFSYEWTNTFLLHVLEHFVKIYVVW